MIKRSWSDACLLAAITLAVILQASARAESIEDRSKSKTQNNKTKPLQRLGTKRQKPPIGFVPSPGSLRQIRSLSESTRNRIRQIVESSRWMALRHQIDELAAANGIRLPQRPPMGPGPPAGPPQPPSRIGEEKLGSDLLAAMIGADKPESSNSSTPRQRKALDEIRKLQAEAHQEWLKVWTAIRPVLSPDNLKELRVINEQEASRYPPP